MFTSPAPVVLATMPPVLSSIANAGRRGVREKSAVVMEQFGLTTPVDGACLHLGVGMGRRCADLTLHTADVLLVRDDLESCT